ncbi:MAG: valine--tRNA ligase [Candidatus Kuenenia stuttgartiensis]|nr:valine--tRNA ligase [Planctomycetia bacterium]MBZ0191662.1 valine--tRNA ligase [Candidatus Kuenenia stuttgartiensis]MCL4727152.1 valine--tRNA ligase [Candidatus Kuenenia stuttgartiensis]SOH06259.1 strongly similar to valyl-tRNA synthetase [Candidatus Kuenenia stuttgartiensis]
MENDLPSHYSPKEVEYKWYRFWEESGFFHSEPSSSKKPYTIVIPPPNVTGVLHVGHALNNIIQDILIRWKRMQGFNVLWMPGTDHAGIATQNVVERELSSKNIKRQDIGRERFIEEVWKWKQQYGSTIIQQLKKLGSSCDWQRERFTMDEGLSDAVKETFVRLYRKGLIYKGKYMINWCPRCRTALADDEVEHEEHEGHLWHIKYSFKENPQQHIVVATTRPETMLGDVAVAVNPKDDRYKDFIGKTLLLPILGRELPVVADDFVSPSFGTGAVKVTPAHDPNDFAIGMRHALPSIVVMDEDGTMNINAGDYNGQDRFECRTALVEDLKLRKHIDRIIPHKHSVGHCYRCQTVIEPYFSNQWFVKMRPLADAAIQASLNKSVTFYPERWEKVYLSWLDNVRDWCISRQIWWGHRIPAWYCYDCGAISVSTGDINQCTKCSSPRLKQDEDVLDTWFSSALWPFSTLGWPKETPELAYYYPTSTLVTDRGIIYFWVARMVMMGIEMVKQVPFSHVYIHGTILDEQGRKMSKSLGNGIDPLLMIDRYGADAVRFSIIILTTEGQDVKLSESKFEMGRNFTNKLWNAARFIFMNLSEENPEEITYDITTLPFEDKWIHSRLNTTIEECTASLDQYKFNDAAMKMYDFTWHTFCDWYLEIVKHRLNNANNRIDKKNAQTTLAIIFGKTLHLLHPFIPFITEELWNNLTRIAQHNKIALQIGGTGSSLVTSRCPIFSKQFADDTSEHIMPVLQDIIRAIRNIRSKMDIKDKQRLKAVISYPRDFVYGLHEHTNMLKRMANLEELDMGIELQKPSHSASEVIGNLQVFVLLAGILDPLAEKDRQLKHLKQLENHLTIIRRKLNNENFVAKAPPQIVETERKKEDDLQVQIEKVKHILLNIG